MLKITESPYIKGFLAKLNLPIDKFTLLNCIKDGKKIEMIIPKLIQFNDCKKAAA